MKKWVVLVTVLALLIAHQDYWQWSRTDLVLGFLPYNMAYHIGISVLTAIVWVVVCFRFWPEDLESSLSGQEAESDAT